MENIMIPVPLNDFVDGVTAKADLDSVRALVTTGAGYCSDSIKAVLGLPVAETDISRLRREKQACEETEREDREDERI